MSRIDRTRGLAETERCSSASQPRPQPCRSEKRDSQSVNHPDGQRDGTNGQNKTEKEGRQQQQKPPRVDIPPSVAVNCEWAERISHSYWGLACDPTQAQGHHAHQPWPSAHGSHTSAPLQRQKKLLRACLWLQPPGDLQDADANVSVAAKSTSASGNRLSVL